MAQRKAKAQDDESVAGGSSSQRLRQLLPTKFVPALDITTIQIKEIILHPDGDQDRGAKRFGRLMSNFLEIARRLGGSPTFIWLVYDPEPLSHVLKAMWDSMTRDFIELERHAVVFQIDDSSPKCELLTAVPGTSCLTAFPDGIGGYEYFRHFKPTDSSDWREGPYCEQWLDNSKDFDEFIQRLHHARMQKLTSNGGYTIMQLEADSIKTQNLEEFLN